MQDEVVGDPSPSASVVGGNSSDADAAHVAHARPLQPEGPLQVFLLVVSDTGLWSGLQCDAAPDSWQLAQAAAGEVLIVGAVLAHAWHLAAADSQPSDGTHRCMRELAARRSHARAVLGFVDYPIVEAMRFAGPVAASLEQALVRVAAMHNQEAFITKPGQAAEEDSIEAVFRRWRGFHAGAAVLAHMAHNFAFTALTGRVGSLHVVAIGQRLVRKALLQPRLPPPAVMRVFMRTAAPLVAAEADAQPGIRRPAWSIAMHDTELVLDWLDSTSYIKQVKQAGLAADSFARILARSSQLSRTQLTSDLQRVDACVLRRARVRLDAVAMLVWRRFWVQMLASGSHVSLYLWSDTSPQRGDEFFATTVDLFDGNTIQRWLLPCLALGPSFMDAIGKTCGVLWQIWLITGPHFEHLRSFLWRVRSITTDLGVERNIVDMVDILKDFFLDGGPEVGSERLRSRALALAKCCVCPRVEACLGQLAAEGLELLAVVSTVAFAIPEHRGLPTSIRSPGHLGSPPPTSRPGLPRRHVVGYASAIVRRLAVVDIENVLVRCAASA